MKPVLIHKAFNRNDINIQLQYANNSEAIGLKFTLYSRLAILRLNSQLDIKTEDGLITIKITKPSEQKVHKCIWEIWLKTFFTLIKEELKEDISDGCFGTATPLLNE